MRKLLLALSTAIGLAYARLFGGPMDGTAYEVKVKADSFFAFSRRGTLVFEKGRLTAVTTLAEGFTPAVYHAQSGDDGIESVWNASLTHVEKGVMTWHGLVRGDHIEGVAVWWVKSGKPRRFTFSGSRRAS